MMVVKHYKFHKEDEPKMLEKWGKYLETSAKNPEKYPKYIFGPAGIATTGEYVKGISIMEIKDDQQIINYMLELAPPLIAEFKILYDTNKYVETLTKKAT